MMLMLQSFFSYCRFIVGCSNDIMVDDEGNDVFIDDDVGYGEFVDICWWRCLPHRKRISLSTVAVALLADKIYPPLSFYRHCCCFVAVFVVVGFRQSSRLLSFGCVALMALLGPKTMMILVGRRR